MSERMLGWIESNLTSLGARPFPLLGCPRRNAWGKPWTSDSASAVLDKVGLRATVPWRGEEIDVYTTPDGDLLMWRGGPWRDWWIQDMERLAAMVQTSSNFHANGVYMLHEVDGRTHVRYVETPSERVQTAYLHLLDRWAANPDHPPRIGRRGDRARSLCWRCPVRERCETSDMDRGETQDWL